MTTETARANTAHWDVQRIPLDQLVISEWNVRNREITADLDELAHSMETYELQQPIVVQRRGDKFEILIGQRRFLAAKQLGWVDIPARVLSQPLNELDAKIVSFSENAQRRELAARDKAEVCAYLREQLGSVKAVADELGVSEQTVRKWLDYAAVPADVKALVEAKKITRAQAMRISEHVADDSKALEIAQKIAELGPAKEHRDRIIAAAQAFPERPLDVILDRAEQMRERREITFILPEQWTSAIDTAARDLDMDAGEIARDATIEWLSTRRYGG